MKKVLIMCGLLMCGSLAIAAENTAGSNADTGKAMSMSAKGSSSDTKGNVKKFHPSNMESDGAAGELMKEILAALTHHGMKIVATIPPELDPHVGGGFSISYTENGEYTLMEAGVGDPDNAVKIMREKGVATYRYFGQWPANRIAYFARKNGPTLKAFQSSTLSTKISANIVAHNATKTLTSKGCTIVDTNIYNDPDGWHTRIAFLPF